MIGESAEAVKRRALETMEDKMNVILLTHTPCAEELIFAAMKQCYSSQAANDIFSAAVVGSMETRELVRDVVASGHVSPIEHVSFTFAIDGISRALTHQLVRHRIASYSQQSQRYVNAEGFEFVVPPKVAAIPEAEKRFVEAMSYLALAYEDIQDILIENGHKKTANEDARYVLPNAAATKIVVTMNCRALLNFFSERCCVRAQWEIREMANRMLAYCQDVLPVVFEGAGAKCRKRGFCPEGEKFTCGKYPLQLGV